MVNKGLPELIEFQGNWEQYIEDLYTIYENEIVFSGITFKGLPVKCQYRPPALGKGFGFWHIISNGPVEDDRLPDLRRCERIRWIPWLIRNVEHDDRISWWQNRRGSNTHVVIWVEIEDFAVILAKRSGYYLLKTAYVVAPHRKISFLREREKFWKGKG